MIKRWIEWLLSHKWYVTLMLEDQAYGGPEEGGWYYTIAERIEHPINKSFWREKSARAYYESCWNDLQKYNEGRPDITSVTSYGCYALWVTEGKAPPFDPPTKPHYE